MRIRISSFVGLALFGATTLNAAPVQNPVTGHYYEVIPGNGITWEAAKLAADGMSHLGVDGHLATITSAGEDAFVEMVRAAAFTAGDITRNEVWVGGVQPCTIGPVVCPPVGEGWIWENLEGSISTPQAPLPSYSNWLPNEPNDNTGAGSENHLAVGLGGNFGWNDEGALGNIGGYVVEFDVPRAATDCSVSEGGCETIDGHELTFPEGSIPDGATIAFNAFEFDDPRVVAGTCGVAPLEIFGADQDPTDEMPSLLIPPYLCGSPKFVVISVDSSELNILDGTVIVENDTETVLPGNLYVCEDPIFQDFPTEGDPQHQDVVVWQTTEPSNMLEVDPGVGGTGQFAGAAGEFTYECGSSRARVKGASYYVVGMSINFGAGFEWSANTAGNFDKFVELTRYKLTLLAEAVEEARLEGALPNNGDYNKMRNMVGNAIKNVDNGAYSDALDHIDNFLKFVDNATYVTGPTIENYNGEHLMRGSNIFFMLRVKILPYVL